MASKYQKAIRVNVDAYYAKTIDYDTFHARQISIWDEIAASERVHDRVLSLLRKGLKAGAR